MKIVSIKIKISGDSYKYIVEYKDKFNKLRLKYALRRFIEELREV